MPYKRNRHFTAMIVAGIWTVSCVCCASAIIYFYGLDHAATVIYPFRSHTEQGAAVVETAVVAMLCSSWAIWFGLNQKRSPRRMALRGAVGTEVSLAVFSVVGLQVALANWRSPLDLIFRSTFFAEYNWLTFVLEVAPVTSCVVGLLLFWVAKVYWGSSSGEV